MGWAPMIARGATMPSRKMRSFAAVVAMGLAAAPAPVFARIATRLLGSAG